MPKNVNVFKRGFAALVLFIAAVWRPVFELAGFGLLTYAGWLVAEPLGFAVGGVACLNFALGTRGKA